MSLNLRLVILICGISFSIAIIKLLIKKKFNERTSLIWLISALGVFIISIFPNTLDVFARLLGVDYPPSILFLLSILVLLSLCFHHSVQISLLSAQVRELTQNMAIKELEYVKDNNLKINYKEIQYFEADIIAEEDRINGNSK